MKEKIKKHYKFILGIVVGLILSSLVAYAATSVASKDITYDNSKSGLSATNVNDALDETYEKVKTHCPDGYTCEKICNVVSGSLSVVGSEIKCGEEEFYMISNDGTNVNMLAKYNLNVGNNKYSSAQEGIQSSNVIGGSGGYGNVAYSASGVNTYASSDAEAYVNSYLNYLINDLKLSKDTTATLLTLEDIVELNCRGGTYDFGSCPYSWVYSTSYWTKSYYGTWDNGPWNVRPTYQQYPLNDFLYSTDSANVGIRPVITISTSSII